MATRHTTKGAVQVVGAVPAIGARRHTRKGTFVPAVSIKADKLSLIHVLVPDADAFAVREAIIARRISGLRLRQLRTELHLSIDVLAKLLDIAPRTVNRKESTKEPLTIAQGDRAFRVARMADLAIELIGDRKKALAWLARPNTYLGGKKPIEMLDTEIGSDLVAQSLHAVAYGATA